MSDYPTGPGHMKSRRGPVVDAYADGALEKPCPHCHAHVDEFCCFRNGEFRHIPCIARTTGSAA